MGYLHLEIFPYENPMNIRPGVTIGITAKMTTDVTALVVEYAIGRSRINASVLDEDELLVAVLLLLDSLRPVDDEDSSPDDD